LRRARRRRFLWRAGELELFRLALDGSGAPWSVLFVYGPGGVGKTALVAAFAEVAETAGTPVWRIGVRDIDASPPRCRSSAPAGRRATGDPLPGRPADDRRDRHGHAPRWRRSPRSPAARTDRRVVACRPAERLALALAEADLDPRRGSLRVRRGKGGRRREVGMDDWAWEQLEPGSRRG
jgi:hypothetical protein